MRRKKKGAGGKRGEASERRAARGGRENGATSRVGRPEIIDEKKRVDKEKKER